MVAFQEQASRLDSSSLCNNSLRDQPLLQQSLAPLSGHFPFGQITDDTQLAREVGLSLLQTSGRIKAVHVGNRMAEVYKNHKMVGAGPTTAVALTKLIQGGHNKTGGDGYGNSPVVRSLPLGLMAGSLYTPCSDGGKKRKSIFESWLQLKEDVVAQSLITHTRHIVHEAAFTFAIAVVLALHFGEHRAYTLASTGVDPGLDVSSFMGELAHIAAANMGSSDMPAHIATVQKVLQTIPRNHGHAAKVLGMLGCSTQYRQQNPLEQFGINGDAVSSLAWGLYCFLSSPCNFCQSLQTCVTAGGDTDSTGAIAGALSGAFLGLSGLPWYMVSLIDDQGVRGDAQLAELAEKLYAQSFSIPKSDTLE